MVRRRYLLRPSPCCPGGFDSTIRQTRPARSDPATVPTRRAGAAHPPFRCGRRSPRLRYRGPRRLRVQRSPIRRPCSDMTAACPRSMDRSHARRYPFGHEKGRSPLPRRRLRLHLPRLSRAAAAEPQVRRPADQRRARLLQHAVEADAATRATPMSASRRRISPSSSTIRRRRSATSSTRIQGQPLGAAGGPDPAVRPDPPGDAGLRPALHRDGRASRPTT